MEASVIIIAHYRWIWMGWGGVRRHWCLLNALQKLPTLDDLLLKIFLSLCVCVCFVSLYWREMCQVMKVTGCDSRQFILLCLNCHLMCMQSGMLSRKKKRKNETQCSTRTRCEDEQLGSDQTHREVDLTHLCTKTKNALVRLSVTEAELLKLDFTESC